MTENSTPCPGGRERAVGASPWEAAAEGRPGAAVLNKVENIVLGAFGCGAFMNDPKVVAAASAEVIKDYLFAFKTIEFAVFCRPGFEQNYREFRNYLGSE